MKTLIFGEKIKNICSIINLYLEKSGIFKKKHLRNRDIKTGLLCTFMKIAGIEEMNYNVTLAEKSDILTLLDFWDKLSSRIEDGKKVTF